MIYLYIVLGVFAFLYICGYLASSAGAQEWLNFFTWWGELK